MPKFKELNLTFYNPQPYIVFLCVHFPVPFLSYQKTLFEFKSFNFFLLPLTIILKLLMWYLLLAIFIFGSKFKNNFGGLFYICLLFSFDFELNFQNTNIETSSFLLAGLEDDKVAWLNEHFENPAKMKLRFLKTLKTTNKSLKDKTKLKLRHIFSSVFCKDFFLPWTIG